MDLNTAIGAIRRSWYLLLIGVLAAIGAAYLMHARQVPLYEADATYVVGPLETTDVSDVAEALRTLDSSSSRAIVATFTEIATSGVVLDEAGAVTGVSSADLEHYEVSAGVVPEANVVTTRVTGPNPEVAVLLSGAVGEAATTRFVATYRIYSVDLLDPPSLPTVPATRSLAELIVVAGALGLLGGVTVALVWGAPRLRRAEEMSSRLGSYGPDGSDARSQPLTAAGGRHSRAG
jgi:capsular polysaccharide biosynthesis protein